MNRFITTSDGYTIAVAHIVSINQALVKPGPGEYQGSNIGTTGGQIQTVDTPNEVLALIDQATRRP